MKIKYFKYAKNMAKMSEFNKFKVGCIVVYKNKIIGQGYNSDKTHPLQQLYNQLRFEDDGVSPHKLHAEMHALMTHVNRINKYPKTYNRYYQTSESWHEQTPTTKKNNMLLKNYINQFYHKTILGVKQEKFLQK